VSRKRSLSIAGIELAVDGPDDLERTEQDPIYAPFVAPVGGERMPVSVVEGEAPDLQGFTPVFDSGVAWTLHRSNGTRLLRFARPGAPGGWLYSAALQGLAERVTVHCGPRMRVVRAGGDVLIDPVRYPLDQLLLMYRLAASQGAIVHAAGAVVDGRAWVFAGRSGAGKSTLMQLLDGEAGIQALGDDRVVLRRVGSKIRAFGTPWPGEARVACNADAPLHAIAFLQQGPEHRLVPLDRGEALVRLLPVASVPWYEPEVAGLVLDFLGELLSTLPVYDLHFALEPGVGELLGGAA